MDHTPWVEEEKASEILGVNKETLTVWREIGYLKPGTHWRSSNDEDHKPWKPKVIYHISWCKEVMDYWRNHDAHIIDLAA